MGRIGESKDLPLCHQPQLIEAITDYCFDRIRQEDRDRCEAHILQCDFCWHEVQRLDSLIQALRSDKSLTQRHFAADIVGRAGISSAFGRFLAGHWIHAGLTATMYSAIVALSVFMEIAYHYDRFGAFPWTAAPVVFLWMAITVIGALMTDWKLTSSRRASGLAGSICVLVAGAALQYIVLRPFLPSYPVTEAAFQTWTAQTAYLKDVVYAVVFAAVFTVLPFHFVITMQRELQDGRHRMAFELLTGSKFGIAPLGAPFVKPKGFLTLLICGAIYSIVSTSHLLEALRITEYSNFFVHTIQLRWLLFLAVGLEGLAWYNSELNELKRESAVVYRLSNSLRSR